MVNLRLQMKKFNYFQGYTTFHLHLFDLAYARCSLMQRFDCFTLIGFILPGMHIRSELSLTFLWIECDLDPCISMKWKTVTGKSSYLRHDNGHIAMQILLFFANYLCFWGLKTGPFVIKGWIYDPSSNPCAETEWISKVISLPLTDIMDMSLRSVCRSYDLNAYTHRTTHNTCILKHEII